MIVLRREKDSPLTRDEVDNNFYELANKTFNAVTIIDPQTIAGIKTFTESPIVPNLTLGESSGKAVNAKFVSDVAANILDNIQSMSMSTTDNTKVPLAGGTMTGDLIINANLVVSGSITETSDIRTKSNIKPLENSLSKVLSLQGVSFTKNSTGEENIGFIAQDVLDVIPEIVKEVDGYYSVAYANVVALLVEAIKEQEIRIQDLEAKMK
jgi:hypothetical protein